MFSLAHAGRVTGDQQYLDAAMVLFREMRDKMRDGPFIGSGSYSRDFMKPVARGGLWRRPWHAADGGRGGRGGGAGAAGQLRPPHRQLPAAAALGPPRAAGAAFAARRHGINLHKFEALLALYEATKSDEVWYEINSELQAIERLFDYKIGYLPESYDENWKPVGNPSGNPGHLFEWASLLSEAVELGADPKYITLGSRNLDLGLKSYNDAVGGLGGVNASGQPTQMLWWPQCEVIKATATYAMLHGRTELWPYFHKTLDFVKKEYLDTRARRLVRRLCPRPAASGTGREGFLQGIGRRPGVGRLPHDLDVLRAVANQRPQVQGVATEMSERRILSTRSTTVNKSTMSLSVAGRRAGHGLCGADGCAGTSGGPCSGNAAGWRARRRARGRAGRWTATTGHRSGGPRTRSGAVLSPLRVVPRVRGARRRDRTEPAQVAR